MVPSWSSTFVLIVAKNPLRSRNHFTTNTFVLIFYWIYVLRLIRFSTTIKFFRLCWIRFSAVLVILIIKDDSFKTEGIKKCSLCERSNMLRIDSSYLICCISLQYHFAVLLNFSYLGMRACNCLNKYNLTSRKSSSFVIVLRLFLIC